MIVGVLGNESDGERGYLANIALSGILPSPSEIEIDQFEFGCGTSILTYDLVHCPLQVEHAGGLISPGEFVR